MSDEHVLVLRTCAEDLTAYGGFKWPESGPVSAPDWNPAPTCGGGLHGLLWGEGNGSLLDWSEKAKWLVVRVEKALIVDLNGKVKFPAGEVIHCGDRASATDHILAHGASGKRVTGACVKAGDHGTATAGYNGTATAGNHGTATAGEGGALLIRYYSTKTNSYRWAGANVGKDEICKPGVKYRLDDNGLFVEVK